MGPYAEHDIIIHKHINKRRPDDAVMIFIIGSYALYHYYYYYYILCDDILLLWNNMEYGSHPPTHRPSLAHLPRPHRTRALAEQRNAEFTGGKVRHTTRIKLLSRSVIANAMNESRNHSANVNLAQIYYVTAAEL